MKKNDSANCSERPKKCMKVRKVCGMRKLACEWNVFLLVELIKMKKTWKRKEKTRCSRRPLGYMTSVTYIKNTYDSIT